MIIKVTQQSIKKIYLQNFIFIIFNRANLKFLIQIILKLYQQSKNRNTDLILFINTYGKKDINTSFGNSKDIRDIDN